MHISQIFSLTDIFIREIIFRNFIIKTISICFYSHENISYSYRKKEIPSHGMPEMPASES